MTSPLSGSNATTASGGVRSTSIPENVLDAGVTDVVRAAAGDALVRALRRDGRGRARRRHARAAVVAARERRRHSLVRPGAGNVVRVVGRCERRGDDRSGRVDLGGPACPGPSSFPARSEPSCSARRAGRCSEIASAAGIVAGAHARAGRPVRTVRVAAPGEGDRDDVLEPAAAAREVRGPGRPWRPAGSAASCRSRPRQGVSLAVLPALSMQVPVPDWPAPSSVSVAVRLANTGLPTIEGATPDRFFFFFFIYI